MIAKQGMDLPWKFSTSTWIIGIGAMYLSRNMVEYYLEDMSGRMNVACLWWNRPSR